MMPEHSHHLEVALSRDLKARLDHLSSQLLNLSLKLDRLLDAPAKPQPVIRRPRKPGGS